MEPQLFESSEADLAGPNGLLKHWPFSTVIEKKQVRKGLSAHAKFHSRFSRHKLNHLLLRLVSLRGDFTMALPSLKLSNLYVCGRPKVHLIQALFLPKLWGAPYLLKLYYLPC
jgi:hypothetical protein